MQGLCGVLAALRAWQKARAKYADSFKLAGRKGLKVRRALSNLVAARGELRRAIEAAREVQHAG